MHLRQHLFAVIYTTCTDLQHQRTTLRPLPIITYFPSPCLPVKHKLAKSSCIVILFFPLFLSHNSRLAFSASKDGSAAADKRGKAGNCRRNSRRKKQKRGMRRINKETWSKINFIDWNLKGLSVVVSVCLREIQLPITNSKNVSNDKTVEMCLNPLKLKPHELSHT